MRTYSAQTNIQTDKQIITYIYRLPDWKYGKTPIVFSVQSLVYLVLNWVSGTSLSDECLDDDHDWKGVNAAFSSWELLAKIGRGTPHMSYKK